MITRRNVLQLAGAAALAPMVGHQSASASSDGEASPVVSTATVISAAFTSPPGELTTCRNQRIDVERRADGSLKVTFCAPFEEGKPHTDPSTEMVIPPALGPEFWHGLTGQAI